MKTLIRTACLMAVFLTAPALAETPVEADAIMSDKLPRSLIEPSVGLIRAHGWRCDSISAMQPFLMSRGFSITCNNFSYEYNIEDKGGNWTVSLDD